jgi:hypothetical protein
MPPLSPLENTLNTLCERLAVWQSRFPEPIDDLRHLAQAFTAKLARLSTDELRLSIGIMGQVKAGKSSFLNALLFEGREVLPVAATPKTANLTRISYGHAPLLTVDFYSQHEWAAIETAAASAGEHSEARVARDLLKMVAEQRVDVAAVLAQGRQSIPATDVDGLMDKLNDYVGENGRLTALVKSTEIQLPLEELKGYDVVDTPGMNDPVPSRTQKTREYMAQCDVVFFLSRCSQFLDQSDMDLLAGQLPGNGVKRMVLVAGQFDGALSDDGFNCASLAQTELNLKTRLSKRAKVEMGKAADSQEQRDRSAIADLLRRLQTPIFASTYAHAFAHQDEALWSKSMQHMHGQLREMADSAWDGYRFTAEDWTRIGNFAALKIAYNTARANKQALLQAQREGLMPETRAELQARLQTLIDTVDNRAEQLRKGDIKVLEKNLQACAGRIQGIAARLSEVMDRTATQARTNLRDIKADLEADAQTSSQLRTRSGTKSITESYQVSTSRWYNPFSWGSKETVYTTRSESYQYIATADAIEKLVQFGQQTTASLRRQFNRLVSLSTLRADLKRSLIQELNTGSQGFNPADFRNTLEGTLNRLTLPELQLELGDIAGAIGAHFSGEISGAEKMAALRATQQQVVKQVLDSLLSAFTTGVDALCAQLEITRDSLGDELASDLQKERTQLQRAFCDKAQELEVYAEILQVSRAALNETMSINPA